MDGAERMRSGTEGRHGAAAVQACCPRSLAPASSVLTCMCLAPCRCRKELSVIFSKIIRARRESGAREEDVLQQFIDARWGGEQGLGWGGVGAGREQGGGREGTAGKGEAHGGN